MFDIFDPIPCYSARLWARTADRIRASTGQRLCTGNVTVLLIRLGVVLEDRFLYTQRSFNVIEKRLLYSTQVLCMGKCVYELLSHMRLTYCMYRQADRQADWSAIHPCYFLDDYLRLHLRDNFLNPDLISWVLWICIILLLMYIPKIIDSRVSHLHSTSTPPDRLVYRYLWIRQRT